MIIGGVLVEMTLLLAIAVTTTRDAVSASIARTSRRRTMDRHAWLTERRAATVAAYDAEAAEYDEHPYPADMQAGYVERLLATCPPGGRVLDAPCGTGRYFTQVVAGGRHVVGIDQSSGMVAHALARGNAQTVSQVGLQELAFEREFDCVMCIDAMEHICPEDWPAVLANLHRALRVKRDGRRSIITTSAQVSRIDDRITGRV